MCNMLRIRLPYPYLLQADRPYLVLLTETWLRSPLRIKGQVVPLADVIKRRSQETMTLYNDIGYKGSTYSPGSQSEQMMFYCETLLVRIMCFSLIVSLSLSFLSLFLSLSLSLNFSSFNRSCNAVNY